MANLADILVSLTLDTSDFNRQLQQVSRDINNMSRTVGTSASQMSTAIHSNTQQMASDLQGVGSTTAQMSEAIQSNTQQASEHFQRVGNSSRYLARTLGTDVDDMNRVLSSAQSEFQRFGASHMAVSQEIQDNFSALPSHLQRYVQRLSDAGQSTAQFAELNQQMSQRIIEHARQSNDYFQQRTTQSQRLMQSFADNTSLAPLTNQFLRLGSRMEQTARQGSVLNLALQRVGENASLKELEDQMKLISTGIARAHGALMVFGVSSGLAIYGMIKLASAVDDRVAPAFERMKGALLDAFEPFITSFATAMVAVMNFVTGLANMINKFSEANPLIFNMIMWIGMLTLVFGTLLAPLAVTGVMAEGVAASFAVLWATISPFVLGFLAVIGVATALAVAFVALWVSIQQLWTNSMAFRDAFVELWNGIKSAVIDNFVTPVKTAWNELVMAYSNLIATVTGGNGTMSSLWQFLGDKIAMVVTTITGIVLPLFQAGMQMLGQVVTFAIQGIITAVNWMSQMWQQHGTQITAVMTTIWTAVQTAFSAIVAFIMANLPQIKGIVTDVFNAVMAVIDFVMKYIAPVVVSAFNVIVSIISFAMPFILSVIVGTWNNIKSVITSTINIIRNVIQLFTNVLKGNWKEAWDNVKNILKNAVTLIWNLIQLYFLGKLLAPLKGFASQGKSIIQAGWNAIKSITTSVMNGIKAFLVGVWNAIKSSLQGSFTGIANLAKTTFTGMKNAIKTIFESVKSTAKTVWEGVKKAITDPVKKAKDAVLKIIKEIVSAFAKMKISIPKPKLPSIDVGSKSFMDGKVKVPTFKLSWHAKGGIFDQATMLGGGHGVGEAGSEAVLPIQHRRYMQPFSSAIAQNLAKLDKDKKSSGGNQYKIEFNEPVVIREDADIQRIVDELERRKRIEERSQGVFSY
jgi:phage-related protein